MKINACIGAPAPGNPGRRAGARRWVWLAAGIAACVLFLAAANLIDRHVPLLQTWGRSIEGYDLRPSAIYYTDYEFSGVAELIIRDNLEYPSADREGR